MLRMRFASRTVFPWLPRAAFAAAVCAAATAAAEDAVDSLLRQLDRTRFAVPSEAAMGRARDAVEEAIRDLQRVQAEVGVESLEWLGIPLDTHASLTPILDDPMLLDAILGQVSQDLEPYERVEFQRLRTAIQLHRRLARVANTLNLAEDFTRHCRAIRQILQQCRGGPDRRLQRRLAREALWLEEYGQGADLVAQIRDAYSHPNLIVRLSATFLDDLSQRPISRREPLSRVSDRLATSGESQLSGNVRLAPDSDPDAPLRLVFQGEISLAAANRWGPVRFSTRAITNVQGGLPIRVGAGGLQGAASPAVTARTCMDNGPSRLGRQGPFARLLACAADKAIARRTPSAARELSATASRRIEQELSGTAGEEIGRINEQYVRLLSAPATRLQMQPRTWRTTADASHISLAFTEDRHCGLAAQGPPPAATDGPGLAAIHESLATDLLNALFRGRNWPLELDANSFQVLNDRFFIELFAVRDFRRDIRLRILLDRRRPFSMSFSPDVIAVTLNLERMVLDEQELRDVRLALSYRMLRYDEVAEEIVMELAAEPQVMVSPRQKRSVPPQLVDRFRSAARLELFSALKNRVAVDKPVWRLNTWTVELTRVKLSEGWLVLAARPGKPPGDVATWAPPSPEDENGGAASSRSKTNLAEELTNRSSQ